MTQPTEQEIRTALEAHAVESDDGVWAFHTHLMNTYSEEWRP